MIMELDVLSVLLILPLFKIWENIFVLAAHKTVSTVLGTLNRTKQSVAIVLTDISFLLIISVILVEMTKKHKDAINVLN